MQVIEHAETSDSATVSVDTAVHQSVTAHIDLGENGIFPEQDHPDISVSTLDEALIPAGFGLQNNYPRSIKFQLNNGSGQWVPFSIEPGRNEAFPMPAQTGELFIRTANGHEFLARVERSNRYMIHLNSSLPRWEIQSIR